MKIGYRLSLLSAAALFCAPILAQQNLTWQVSGGVENRYETNPTRVVEDVEDDPTVGCAATGNNCIDGDNRIRASVSGGVNYINSQVLLDFYYTVNSDTWLNDSFNDRRTLQGYGQFAWTPADFFQAFFRNTRYDTLTDSQQPDTPDNRSVRSVSEAGLVFTANLGAVDSLNFSPIYRQVRYLDGDGIDSQRPGATVYWLHRFSPNDEFRANIFGETVKFKNASDDVAANDQEGIDLNRAQAFLGYGVLLNRLGYNIDLGYTWVDPDEAEGQESQNYSGPLIRAVINYQHLNHYFQFRFNRDLTDTSIGIAGQGVGGGFFGGNTGASDVSELALVNLTQFAVDYRLNFADARWSWSIGYRYDQIDVEAQPVEGGVEDQNRNWVNSTLGYQMTRRVSARLYGRYLEYDYTSTGINEQRYNLGLVFDFRVFKYGYINLGVEREQFNSSADIAIADPLRFIDNTYSNDIVYANFQLVYPALQAGRGLGGGLGGGGLGGGGGVGGGGYGNNVGGGLGGGVGGFSY
jgi:hypothetical protein